MEKDVCFMCGAKEVTAYATKYTVPLCTKCWKDLYEDRMTVEEIERKVENEQEG